MGTTFSNPNWYLSDRVETDTQRREREECSVNSKNPPTEVPDWTKAFARQLVGRCVTRYDDGNFTTAMWLKHVSPQRHLILWNQKNRESYILGPRADDGMWMSAPDGFCGGIDDQLRFFRQEREQRENMKEQATDCETISKLLTPPQNPSPELGYL